MDCVNDGGSPLDEAELEHLLIKHFALAREHEASSDQAGLVRGLPRELPAQRGRLLDLVPALLDWKLKLVWPRLGMLLGCAVTGLLVGFFGPAPERVQPHLTAIAYAMPAPDFLADSE